MADKPWKRVEREKCTALGGTRTGPRGFGLPDCVGLEIGLEVKYVKKYVFLTADWEQAIENAERIGKPPVLAVKEANKRGGRDCVQMFEADYSRLRVAAGQPAYPFGWTNEPTRMSWGHFERLYRAAYIDNKE